MIGDVEKFRLLLFFDRTLFQTIFRVLALDYGIEGSYSQTVAPRG